MTSLPPMPRITRRLILGISILMLTSPAHAQDPVNAQLPELQIHQGFAELVEAVLPAVVNVSVPRVSQENEFAQPLPPQFEEFFRHYFGEPPQRRTPPDRRRRGGSAGSGFIVDPGGLIVTNHHVIEGAEEIEVVFGDGRRAPATLRGSDPKTDLALLEIEAPEPLPYVEFGSSDDARIGDWVIAIGNPFGLGGTTTMGIISARGRDIRVGPLDDFIQIDAPINRGNSGGPLFNTRGEVIGVNSVIYSPTGGNVGIGFAIPSGLAQGVVAQLTETGSVQHGYLGVYIQSVDEDLAETLGLDEPRGALITDVIPESPAAAAGLIPGDVVLEFDGRAVEEVRDLPRFVARTRSGTEVNAVVWRNEREETLALSVGSDQDRATAADNDATNGLPGLAGLEVETLNAANRERFDLPEELAGVLVTGVSENLATGISLRPGDVIRRIGNQPLNSVEDLRAALEAARTEERNQVALLVQRGDNSRFLALPLNF